MQTVYVVIHKDSGKVLSGTRPYTSRKIAEAAIKVSVGYAWHKKYDIVPYVPQDGGEA